MNEWINKNNKIKIEKTKKNKQAFDLINNGNSFTNIKVNP